MKLTTIFTLVLSPFGASTLASPILNPRGWPGGVYISDGAAWKGSYAKWLPPKLGICLSLGDGPIVSFGPDQGALCVIHE